MLFIISNIQRHSILSANYSTIPHEIIFIKYNIPHEIIFVKATNSHKISHINKMCRFQKNIVSLHPQTNQQ